MDMRIPPFEIKILLESNPLKSRILVRVLAVGERPARKPTVLWPAPAPGPAVRAGRVAQGDAAAGGIRVVRQNIT